MDASRRVEPGGELHVDVRLRFLLLVLVLVLVLVRVRVMSLFSDVTSTVSSFLLATVNDQEKCKQDKARREIFPHADTRLPFPTNGPRFTKR